MLTMLSKFTSCLWALESRRLDLSTDNPPLLTVLAVIPVVTSTLHYRLCSNTSSEQYSRTGTDHCSFKHKTCSVAQLSQE